MTSRVRSLCLLLALALAGGAATAHAQDASPVEAAAEAIAPAVGAEPAAGAVAAGVENAPPARPVAPRSMRPYWHLFIAFGLTWVLLLGYVVSLARRFARLGEVADQLRHDA